jgi:hypothetical protein
MSSDENYGTVMNTTVNLFSNGNMNTTDWNQTLNDGSNSQSRSDHNLFFIFPAMGLMVLIMGSLYLRDRRIEQSQQSARAYDARLRAHHECIRLKKAMRLEMVENALVTTKVVIRSQHPSARRSSFASTETTLDSSNSSTDYVVEDTCDDIEAQSADCVMSLEKPIDTAGWKLESCAICLEPYQENDSVSYSKHQNCSHAFHTDCILNWLQHEYRNDCPYCRSQYVHVCITEPESDDDIFAGDAPSTPDEDQDHNTDLSTTEHILAAVEQNATNNSVTTEQHLQEQAEGSNSFASEEDNTVSDSLQE